MFLVNLFSLLSGINPDCMLGIGGEAVNIIELDKLTVNYTDLPRTVNKVGIFNAGTGSIASYASVCRVDCLADWVEPYVWYQSAGSKETLPISLSFDEQELDHQMYLALSIDLPPSVNNQTICWLTTGGIIGEMYKHKFIVKVD